MNIKQILKEEIESVGFPIIQRSFFETVDIEKGDFKDNNTKSPEWIVNYVNSLHKNGWEKTKYGDKEWILSHKYFKLETISFTDNKINNKIMNWQFKYPLYNNLNSSIPPIVIGEQYNEYYIMDGMHRAGSAIELGNKTIEAYIGFI